MYSFIVGGFWGLGISGPRGIRVTCCAWMDQHNSHMLGKSWGYMQALKLKLADSLLW